MAGKGVWKRGQGTFSGRWIQGRWDVCEVTTERSVVRTALGVQTDEEAYCSERERDISTPRQWHKVNDDDPSPVLSTVRIPFASADYRPRGRPD
jgi:hypothetical protein